MSNLEVRIAHRRGVRTAEVWVPLLEKAVAKFCGTFGNLNGGQALYAWQIMTGCNDLCEFRRNEGEDAWMHVQVAPGMESGGFCSLYSI